MTNKNKLDFGGLAFDVAHTIEDAISRRDARTKRKAKEERSVQSAPTLKPTSSSLDAKPSAVGNTPPKAEQPRKQKAKKTEDKPPATKADPWVNATFKVRDSKRERLHRLHLKRQLEGLTPYTKQDFLDEALDYVLSRYEGRLKSRGAAD